MTTSSDAREDLTTLYAEYVHEGELIAGPHVRDACKRHLNDLTRAKKKSSTIVWDLDAALWALNFFPSELRLNGGEFEGAPFYLQPWQTFVVGSLFGWKGIDGYRRFRVAYIETGKGSGKSPLVAGIGIIMMTVDGEYRAEVYAAAAKKDQAQVLFRDAVAMVEQAPRLSKRIVMSGGQVKNNMAFPKLGSFFRPISSEQRGRGQSGPRPHCALLDEVHEHPTNVMVEMMRAGTKQRTQALICMITNSGNDKRTPCWNYHSYGARVCAGEIEDDGFFAYVCALDDNDDPLEDEGCWPKANPSLPATPGYKYIREQVTEARGMPSKEQLVRRLNFCQWIDGVNPLFSRDVWVKTLADLDIAKHKGKRCIAALDLSSKVDLTALALMFANEDGTVEVFIFYWTPEDTMDERARRDEAPYPEWARKGYIQAVPGKSIRYEWVATAIADLIETYKVETMLFDRWKIDYLTDAFDDLGVEWHNHGDERGFGLEIKPHGQGFKDMGVAIDALEELVVNEQLRVENNTVSTMCVANCAVVMDPAENRKFAKNKSTGRIDGAVALAMVCSAAQQLLTESDDESWEIVTL